jgi:hypothetical protein
VGGSLNGTVPHNDFLCTTVSYDNFILRLKFKLIGTAGFINAGVQFRSKRLTDPSYEMIGYQADLGPKYWASLYDESRRNITLVQPDSLLILKQLKPNDWNEFEIHADNRHISIFLNGKQTVDYIEKDETIPQSGIIGLQIHGGVQRRFITKTSFWRSFRENKKAKGFKLFIINLYSPVSI